MDTEYLLQLLTYVLIYSFAGWVLESVSKTIEQRKFVNSGFLNGPFCPIYGFGALIMILFLDSLQAKPILLFIVAFITLSIWEYIVGVFLEKVFKTKYWDYSDIKFNFQGRVCLKNSIFWGVLGVIFIRYMHPFIEGYVIQIPINMLTYIDIMIAMAIVVDTVASIIAITNFESASNKLNELSNNIKDKMEELNILKDKGKSKTKDIEKTTVENIEKMIYDLKLAQNRLKIKMYKRAIRWKKAFPSMKSETISEFLNQKIDLKKLKENIKRNKEQ